MPTLAQPDYTFDDAIRKRFQTITDIGAQQNNYVNQQANVRQQRALQERQMALQNAAMQGAQNFSGGAVDQGGKGTGKYASNPNPRSVDQALAFARQAVANGDSNWYRQCLAFVARAYGLASGSPTAIAAYQLANSRGQVRADSNPNIGSIVYWSTGPGRAGHAALYAGNGYIYSNDIGGAGKIAYVPLSTISQKWGAQYLGWSDPYFAASPRR